MRRDVPHEAHDFIRSQQSQDQNKMEQRSTGHGGNKLGVD